MNPFTHSTVARPLPAGSSLRGDAAANQPVAGAHRRAVSKTLRHERRRSGRRSLIVGAALGVLAGVPAAGAVDLNSATLDQLQSLRGVGPRTARVILDERRRAGPYASIEDLSDRVRGIGPRKAAALQASGLRIGPVYRVLREQRESAAPRE